MIAEILSYSLYIYLKVTHITLIIFSAYILFLIFKHYYIYNTRLKGIKNNIYTG